MNGVGDNFSGEIRKLLLYTQYISSARPRRRRGNGPTPRPPGAPARPDYSLTEQYGPWARLSTAFNSELIPKIRSRAYFWFKFGRQGRRLPCLPGMNNNVEIPHSSTLSSHRTPGINRYCPAPFPPGGPRRTRKLLARFPAEFPLPDRYAQHMPPNLHHATWPSVAQSGLRASFSNATRGHCLSQGASDRPRETYHMVVPGKKEASFRLQHSPKGPRE